MAHFIFGIGEHVNDSCHGNPKGTPLHTIDERRRFAKQQSAREIPEVALILDHAGGELETGPGTFVVPHDKKIGRMVETMVRGDGQFAIIAEIHHEQRALAEQIKRDLENGIPWGFSLGKNLDLDPERFDITNKTIEHIGLTRNPQYGGEPQGPTWVSLAASTPEGLYKKLGPLLAREPDMYIPQPTRDRFALLIPGDAQSDSPQPLESPSSPLGSAALSSPPPLHQVENEIMATADPMQGVTTAAAAVPPPATAKEDAELAEIFNRTTKLRDAVMDNGNKLLAKGITWENFKLAEELFGRLSNKMQGVGLAQMPIEQINLAAFLRGFTQEARDVVGQYNKAEFHDNNQEMYQFNEGVLANPTKKENYAPAMQVFASYQQKLSNTEEFNQRFSEQHKKMNEMEESLKRAREETTQVRIELEQTKRARLEDAAAVAALKEKSAAAALLTASAPIPIPGATAAGAPAAAVAPAANNNNSISVGASAGTWSSSLPPGVTLIKRTQPEGGGTYNIHGSHPDQSHRSFSATWGNSHLAGLNKSPVFKQ